MPGKGRRMHQDARETLPVEPGGGLSGTRLVCFFCGAVRAPDLHPVCRACGGTMIARTSWPGRLPAGRRFWEFADLLPVSRHRVSLGEGGTPLLKLDRLFPDDEVYAKAEWTNATGSFKDRGSAVAMSAAMSLGAKGIICASTGNNAASVSAFAARAGLPCIVALPKGTPANKIIQAKAHGAIVLEVAGDFSDAYSEAERIQRAVPGWANLTSTYINAYMTAAHATILYELHAEIGAVGTVIVPIGAGPMLDGIMQGARTLHEHGHLERLPRPVGVQASGCAPIAAAFARGQDVVAAWAAPVSGIAGSINDPLRGYPDDGTRTLRIMRSAGGHAVAVTDAQIERAMLDLGRCEGIAAEPAAATPLAALRDLADKDLPRPIVLVISGHALKDPAAQPGASGQSLDVEAGAAPAAIVSAALRQFAQRML
ncbi:pyridoxal-phosphate dependent enzyme [Vineibacter terrae]|uniref:pyridoxal-phosphate dependent enzyme n=1 Tax=Vineibacter terrae TaxID=2586908 RepID=UPI002E3245A0|nr:pyridoxal-phosphate dependent enzyme [Vineibacter terrae]HEX2885428.1 pyridoxal-phosphate dependent enzyme [Vineibacter terrae]